MVDLMKMRKFGFVLMAISLLVLIGSYMYTSPTSAGWAMMFASAKSSKQIYEPKLSELKVVFIPSKKIDTFVDQELLDMGYTKEEVSEYRQENQERTVEYSIEYRSILLAMISIFFVGLYLFIFPKKNLVDE